MLTNDQLGKWDRESFFHPSTHLAQHARGESPARIITGGKGAHIEDRDGNKLLDAFAGLYCVNVGYGRTEIADAIAAQAKELAYYHAYVGHGTEASITLANMVHGPRAENMSRSISASAGRTPTRPTSSWSGTTTTSSAGPRRRRSSRAGAATTAPA
jgi:L-2,4-diaminobutyrate transaminase